MGDCDFIDDTDNGDRHEELLAIVRELAGLEPCWETCRCPEDGGIDSPRVIQHEPDCLWLRAQKFKEK
jgi:hypothetical protein